MKMKASDLCANEGEEHVNDNIVRQAAQQYFFINSADRYQNADTLIGSQPNNAAWNNFVLQKPMPLVNNFTNRIAVSEISFPWYIPNITAKNNTLTILTAVFGIVVLTVDIGFYTKTDLEIKLNALGNPYGIQFEYGGSLLTNRQNVYTIFGFNASASQNLTIIEPNFLTQPSLAKTMGVGINQVNVVFSSITASPVPLIYTPYVDIVSNELMKYSGRDNSSSNSNNNGSVICRIYAFPESNSNPDVGQNPFMIYRQFVNPKSFYYRRDALVDWFSVQVQDAWGNLVPINCTMPDFQITCLTSG